MKSLNSIFRNFRKTLRDLDKYVEKANQHIDKNEEKMVEIQADQMATRFDREKASNARAKIADLIGEDE